ncbi:DUF465 domain-containing protein [Silanimonas sp.]|uniref:YdcH family protein n=1 Tax=Silanimonas sp. TaxID=1929290 RepID=UPI001BBB74C9|nr:DUF465 domain-containing protein [Silanimonas sp.]MBS3896730.1 DUF465 domain-containing protein [Silanimonas sp.]MBS3924622.1 DUF465 domain-containing protein [Xanthomonadaceae bacterium]MBS3924998.1 DUF465 domain-containing protein [Xanthomonadaceae bacterium]
MNSLDPGQIAFRLIELRSEHRDLDAAIAVLAMQPDCDEVRLKRMKKRKLAVKDQIAWLENKLIPDLDA